MSKQIEVDYEESMDCVWYNDKLYVDSETQLKIADGTITASLSVIEENRRLIQENAKFRKQIAYLSKELRIVKDILKNN
jgi:hypothetical protein